MKTPRVQKVKLCPETEAAFNRRKLAESLSKYAPSRSSILRVSGEPVTLPTQTAIQQRGKTSKA